MEVAFCKWDSFIKYSNNFKMELKLFLKKRAIISFYQLKVKKDHHMITISKVRYQSS